MAKIQELKFTDKSYEKIVEYLEDERCYGIYHKESESCYFVKEEGWVIINHRESELVSVNIPGDVAKSLEAITR